MKYLKLFEDWNLMESLSSAREKYLITNQISPEEFNLIKDLDPSKNFKYVEKMIDVYLKDSPNLEELGRVFKDFDEMSKKNQLKNPDITYYRSFSEILDTTQKTFSEYKEKQDLKSKANGIDIVYEDDKVLVLIPRTHEATCKYGSGTKWCITEKDPRYYLRYKQNLVTHYFVIMKGLPMSNPNYKMAVSVYKGGGFECNDALDERIPLEKVLEISGLDKGLFVSNPTLTLEEKLLDACEKGDVEEVKKLIDAGAKVRHAKDKRGNSPLHWASLRYNVAIAELLISAGADVDSKDNEGRSPLHYAVSMGNIALAEYLISAGADLDIQDKKGSTPLNLATTLSAKLLISAGANLDIEDKKGFTPLHYAVEENNIALTKLLISAGANLNIQDKRGYTPLHTAVLDDNVAFVELLISAGAKVNIKTNSGNSPLYFASYFGNKEMIALLKKNGAVE